LGSWFIRTANSPSDSSIGIGQLDLPMTTTQLAHHLDLSAPTVNSHLKALFAAGIIAARRDGRSVLYTRTPLGEQLLAGGGDA
jgi:DNA-binding transcriptional ArsR family regulator